MTRKSIVLMLVAVFAAGGWLIYAQSQQTANIGYVACLSGRNAELGLEGLKGVQFALDEHNRSNRDSGFQASLTVADNHCQPQEAWRAVDNLLDAGVDVIIGHMLSEMSATTLQRIEESGVVMLSPTTASHTLSHRDDPFLRIYPDTQIVGEKNADFANNLLGFSRLAVIYDRSNYAFSMDVLQAFRARLEGLGSEVVAGVPFNGQSPEMSYSRIVEQVASRGVDGILILANPGDTAMLCQQVSRQQLNVSLFAAEWSHSPQLHQLSGHTTENLYIFQTVNESDRSPAYRNFSRLFRERFGKDPWFASVHGYDATRTVLAALERNHDPRELKTTLLGMGTFHGVQSMITLDKFGDAERTHYIEKVTGFERSLLAML